MSVADYQLLFNKWDKEVTKLMLGSEKQYKNFYDGSVEISPVVGIQIGHLQAYQWVQCYESKMAYRENMFWTCRHLNILSPTALIPAQVILNIEVCIVRLTELKKAAPKLRIIRGSVLPPLEPGKMLCQ
jgi:hypothetical protein